MDQIHFHFEKISEDEKRVKYSIRCSDFRKDLDQEDMGRVQITKLSGKIRHTKSTAWKRNGFYPLDIFTLKPRERNRLIQAQYANLRGVEMCELICRFINECVRSGVYPEQADRFS